MGWLWGSSEPKSSSSDPFSNLDPSLKEFLEKESPVKYKPAAPPPPPPPQKPQSQRQSPDTPPTIPSQSLFQDGRYAHLWKNYRPLDQVENECKSDPEKLQDVLEGYKERKAQIGRAALENCSMEQSVLMDCYEGGRMTEKFLLCRPQKKSFERCYQMQTRFLKALGYLSSFDRPESVDDDIQMHADTLYHRMLDQEKAIEEAKAAGRPVPDFANIEAPAQQSPTRPAESLQPPKEEVAKTEELPALSPETIKVLKPEAALALRERIKDLTPVERELEEKSAVADLMNAVQAGEEFNRIRGRMTEERRKRREEGKGTASDTVSGWLGW